MNCRKQDFKERKGKIKWLNGRMLRILFRRSRDIITENIWKLMKCIMMKLRSVCFRLMMNRMKFISVMINTMESFMLKKRRSMQYYGIVYAEKEKVYAIRDEMKRELQAEYDKSRKVSNEFIRKFSEKYDVCIPNDIYFNFDIMDFF